MCSHFPTLRAYCYALIHIGAALHATPAAALRLWRFQFGSLSCFMKITKIENNSDNELVLLYYYYYYYYYY